MPDQDNPVDVMLELDKPKSKKAKQERQEKLDKIVNAVDAEVGDAYSYSGSDTYRQMGEAWRRYYQQPFGNEDPDYSTYVSGMLTKHVNQIRAWGVDKYGGSTAPIIKFSPRGRGDMKAAEMATEFTNHVFRNKLDGNNIIDNMVFNAALLKIAPLRVYAKPKPKAPDTYEYEFEGTMDDFVEDYSKFEVANPALAEAAPTVNTGFQPVTPPPPDVEAPVGEPGGAISPQPAPPELTGETVGKIEMKWDLELPGDKEIAIDVISPGSFFVSRQAEHLDDARMVAQIALMRISDLKLQYPDAPKLNGEDDELRFWEELQSEYIEWFRENEWLERWNYDSLGLNETEDSQSSDDAAGLGSREIFVMDAEIWLDVEDTGDSKLYHVVKAGGYVLGLEEIAERSFICGSLIPTGNRWIGLGIFDIIQHDLREESTNTRAFTDAALMSAHPHPVIDMGMVEEKDIHDLQPGSVIRVKQNATATGRSAIEWSQAPGPNPATLDAVNLFKQNASVLTGVGQGFQGGTMSDNSKMRIGQEAAKIIDNNSSLMLNYFSHKLDEMIGNLLVKIWKVAVMAGVSPEVFHSKGEWVELDPAEQDVREEYIINPEVGIDARAERRNQAQEAMLLMANPIPGVQWLPQAGYEFAKKWLETNEIFDADNYLVNPTAQQEIAQDPQVMAFMQQQQAQMQQEMQMAIEQARQEILQMPDAMLKQAQANLATAKAQDVPRSQGHNEDRDAMQLALQADKEDRLDERAAVDKAIDMRRVDLQEQELETETDIAYKELAKGVPTSNIGSG